MIGGPRGLVQYRICIKLFFMEPLHRPLDLDWLEDFLALAESGNFSRAAQARAIAQPAFSRHIRALEAWVGSELVDRSAHPAVLTAAGQALRPAVEDLLRRLDRARLAAREAAADAQRALRIAATHALSMTFFPAWLQTLESGIQIGAIQMMSDSLRPCEDAMLMRRVQFLLCHGHADVPTRLDEAGLPHLKIGTDRIVPVAKAQADGAPVLSLPSPDASPPGASPAAGEAAAAPLPLLAYSGGSGLGQILSERLPALRDAARFAPVFVSHHAVLLRTMAIEGRGIAWLPASLVAADLDAARLAPAAAAAEAADWSVPIDVRLYGQAAGLTQAARALWDFVRAAAEDPATIRKPQPDRTNRIGRPASARARS